jgi:hypothetical protein
MITVLLQKKTDYYISVPKDDRQMIIASLRKTTDDYSSAPKDDRKMITAPSSAPTEDGEINTSLSRRMTDDYNPATKAEEFGFDSDLNENASAVHSCQKSRPVLQDERL